MNFLKAILVILGMWLGPPSLAPGIFPVTTTTTSMTSTSTTSTLVMTSTVPASTSTLRVPASVDVSDDVSDDVWWSLALCEDGGKNRQFGSYHGYFHFALATWYGVGGTGLPEDHDYETQKHFAQILQSQEGWWPWPGCKIKLGL